MEIACCRCLSLATSVYGQGVPVAPLPTCECDPTRLVHLTGRDRPQHRVLSAGGSGGVTGARSHVLTGTVEDWMQLTGKLCGQTRTETLLQDDFPQLPLCQGNLLT